MTAPPYLRIVEHLRKRIESGELKPGARVPSTRALARRWKVATATAAHALRALMETGLVRAVPRSGTVVSGPTRAPVSREGTVTQARIVAAAIEMADEEGLSAVSFRGLAAALATPVMSLYRHVRSKEELLSLMTDHALSEGAFDAPPQGGWRAQLEHAARREWQVLRRHPWLARVIVVSRPTPLPNAMAFADWVLRALDESALTAPEKLEIHIVLHSFVQGIAVNLEAEAQAMEETGITEEDHMRAHEPAFAQLVASGRYPAFGRMLREMPARFDLDLDALFETGLEALLDGLAPRIEGRRAARKRLGGSRRA